MRVMLGKAIIPTGSFKCREIRYLYLHLEFRKGQGQPGWVLVYRLMIPPPKALGAIDVP